MCHSAVFSHYITVCNVLGDVASGNGMIVTELQITNTSVCVCVHVREQGQTVCLMLMEITAPHACMWLWHPSLKYSAGTIRCDVFFLKIELEVVCTVLHIISFEPSKRFSFAPLASLSNFASV